MTIVNAAVSAVVAALERTPAVCGSVHRVRVRPIKASESLAVVVRPLRAARLGPSEISRGPRAWGVDIAVECYARASATSTPDVAVDALVDAVHGRLMEDPTLGGAVRWIEPESLQLEFDADEQSTACASFVFTAQQVIAGSQF